MSDTRYDTPEPFKVDIPERALIDLDERLRRWRARRHRRQWHVGLRHRSRVPRRPGRLLAPRLRLAALPGGDQPLAQLPGRYRPAADPLHPRAGHRGRGRAAADAAGRHPRLAGLDRRVPRHHRCARPSGDARRRPARRLRRDRAVAARLRLLRPADPRGRQHRPDRPARHRRPVAQARAREAQLPPALRRAGR